MSFVEGWTYKPDAIAESVERMVADNLLVLGAGKSFVGEWSRRVSAGETAFIANTKEEWPFKAYRQATGICTSELIYSLMDCYRVGRKRHGLIAKDVDLCFETLFAISRSIIGKNSLGYQDGSCGAWVAETVARFGVKKRSVYGRYDLTKPREDLAQLWGRPDSSVPREVIDLGGTHRFLAHKASSTDEIADGIASACFGGICREKYTSAVDSQGFALFNNNGGHHTCIRGAYIDQRTNQRVFIEQQTHGPGDPSEHPIAYTTEGEVELSDGAYLVRESDIQRFMSRGEVWLFQPVRGEEFR